MSKGAMDALFGAVQQDGVDLELQGGFNFKAPLKATPNEETGVLDLEVDTDALAGELPGGGVTAPGTTVVDVIPAFDDTEGAALRSTGYTVSTVTKMPNVWWVDSSKTVTGTRDGSMARPFDTMADALQAWSEASIGTIFVGNNPGGTWTFPTLLGGTYTLRIVGIFDNQNDGVGRTFIGRPNASVEIGGSTLNLILENVQIGATTWIANTTPTFLRFELHNSRLGDVDATDPQITVTESHFFDSDFYQNLIQLPANAGPPHFHNCLMGEVVFGAVAQKAFCVTPQNRSADSGSGQGFAFTWPSINAGNKLYCDGVTNYLAPTMTNGTKVVMS